MKLLQISKFYYPKIGGIERIVQDIAEALKNLPEFEVEVLCCGKKKKIESINGVRVIRAKTLFNFWGMPISFDFLRTFAKIRNNFDIIDFHHPFPLGDLAIFLFPPKAKIVVHYHSDIVRQKPLEFFIRPLILNTLKKSSKIVVSNPNLINTSPILKKFREKCQVVPFGIKLEDYQNPNKEEVEEIRRKYGNFVLFVGRLSYYKGVSYLIEAVKDLDVNLVIIGRGQQENKLRALVKKLKMEPKVFFLDFQPKGKLINFYHTCRVFVLPSIYRSEAFGIVLMEAMACGKPVISTELGTGTSWVNQNNITGFVVPPKSSKHLRQAIEKILSDPEIYEKFSHNAFLRAKKIFQKENMIEKIKDVYLGL